jgi:hypothetical protein
MPCYCQECEFFRSKGDDPSFRREETVREGEWSREKVRIWQCAIKGTGLPPAQEALDSLIDSYCAVLQERDELREANRSADGGIALFDKCRDKIDQGEAPNNRGGAAHGKCPECGEA